MNKAAITKFLVRVNAFAPFRLMNRARIPVLMYHRFSAHEEYGKTSRQTLQTHLKYLKRHYRIISLNEAVARLREGAKVPAGSAVITVDDGYRDFYEIAFPVFKEFQVPATLYVVTDFIGGKGWIWTDKARFILTKSERSQMDVKIGQSSVNIRLDGLVSRLTAAGKVNSELKKLPDELKDEHLNELAAAMDTSVPELPPNIYAPLDWAQARELQDNGIDIGSHTVSHPILTNVDDVRLASELLRSKMEIKDKLQKDEVHFCYPNGNVAARERAEAEKAGYASAVTTEIRLCENSENRFMIPRIDAEPEMHRFVQATSGADAFKSRVR